MTNQSEPSPEERMAALVDEFEFCRMEHVTAPFDQGINIERGKWMGRARAEASKIRSLLASNPELKHMVNMKHLADY